MDNNTIKNVLDSLTSRGVLSADGRRQMFTILLEQAREHNDKVALLEADLERVRSSRNALSTKVTELTALVPKSKLPK